MMSLGMMDEVDSEARPLHCILSDTLTHSDLRYNRTVCSSKQNAMGVTITKHVTLCWQQDKCVPLYTHAVHDEHVGQRKSSILL